MNSNHKPPRLKKNAQETIDSAVALARLVLNEPKLSDTHKKGVLNYVIWKITEAKYSKYKLPLRTEAAHAVLRRGGSRGLRHEHVFTRKWLVLKLLKAPRRAKNLLNEFAIGCVVTKREAARLDKHHRKQGWKRYRALKLRVIELQHDGAPAPFTFPR